MQKQTSLMYNPSNEDLYTRAQLHTLVTPPAMGRYHNPVPFGDYADLIAHRAERCGMEITAEEYAVDKEGNKMFGMIEVEPFTGEYISAKDWKLQIGLRGSHDQSIPRGLALGSSVMVCSNLCFHGDVGSFQTRQTTNVWERLPALVQNALERVPELARHNQIRFDHYRQMELRPRHGDAALVEIHRRGGLSAPQLARAIAQWDKPDHEEHAEDGYTVWRLFNATTEALKPTESRTRLAANAMEQVRQRSQVASTFLDEVSGL